jgi:hypothetical protein
VILGCVVDEASHQDLINGLLAYSRIGRGELQMQILDTNALVEEVESSLASAIAGACAEVIVCPLPNVQADRRQLTQVFQNLLSNALKFCDGDAPRVEISAAWSDRAWLFSVADNGIGVGASRSSASSRPSSGCNLARRRAPGRLATSSGSSSAAAVGSGSSAAGWGACAPSPCRSVRRLEPDEPDRVATATASSLDAADLV